MSATAKSIALLTIVLALTIVPCVDSNAIGPAGNRVTGSVDDKAENEPLQGVRVSFHKREKPYDITDENGVFYLVIPKDIDAFRLDFVKDGYASKMSDRDYQSHEPVKHHRVLLEKPDPNMSRQEFQSFIDNEIIVYAVTNTRSKAVIRANMNQLAAKPWVKNDEFKRALVGGAVKKMERW